MKPLTAMEKLQHIAECPDGCGVCKIMAIDVRARIAELVSKLLMAEGCAALSSIGVDAHEAAVMMGKETMFKLVAAEKRVAELEAMGRLDVKLKLERRIAELEAENERLKDQLRESCNDAEFGMKP